jgi:type I restriction enzyme S subunit
LNEVYNFIDYRGKTPNKITQGVPLVTAANIKKGYMDYTERYFISRKEFETRKTRGIARNGDILFTTEAPLGNVALADLDNYSTGQRVIAFQSFGDNEDLCNLLFAYFLLSPNIQKLVYDKRSGMTASGVKASLLKLVLIPIPPLVEQQRIVAKVNELMGMCDELETAEKELDTLENHFAKYLSKSILQAAVQGKLVPQNIHDEPATELLKRIQLEKKRLIRDGKIKKEKPLPLIAEDEVPYDLPDGWVWCRLGELFELISGRDLETTQFNSEMNGIPYITGASAIDGESILVNRWTDSPSVISRDGDILLSCKGTVGKIVINTTEECHIARQIMAIRISSNGINCEYIKLFLHSHVVQLNIQAKSIIPGISRDDVLFALMPLPPSNEQQRITDKAANIMELCEELNFARESAPVFIVPKVIPFPKKKTYREDNVEIGVAARGDITQPLSEKLQNAIDDWDDEDD